MLTLIKRNLEVLYLCYKYVFIYITFILKIKIIVHKYWALVTKSVTPKHMYLLHIDADIEQMGG